MLKHGFIEKVSNPRITTGHVHYIPHNAVLKDSSTTPLQIAYDCSCSPNGNQLHELEFLPLCRSGHPQRHDYHSRTFLLLSIRYHRGHKKSIFEYLLGCRRQRCHTIFFWLSDITDPESPLEMYRFKSILFGATCSPFTLNATIQKHLDQFHDPVTQRLYVDNLPSGTDDENKATNFLKNARSII